jgi:hypothetical protein
MINNTKNTSMQSAHEVKTKNVYAFAPQDGHEAFSCEADTQEEANAIYEAHIKKSNA